MISVDEIFIPNWISCHTYFFGKEESRTYISNEKSHEYIQLDGISSDLWKLLYDRVCDEELADFAEKNGVAEQVYDFIDSLTEQGLIVFKKS